VLMFEHEESNKTELCVETSLCNDDGINSYAKRL
jgi:hypothetical protein